MTRLDNEWTSRYSAVASLDEIRRLSRVPAMPLIGLGADPVEVACERIRREWKRIFVPTDQACDIMLMLLELALAHARLAYPDELTMSARSYEEALDIEPYVPVCLTGLQGVGKSTLLRALARVLPPDDSVAVRCTGDRFPLVGMRAVVVKGLRSPRAVLRAIAGVECLPRKTECLESACSRSMYRCGCCLVALDELQFVTQSEQASTLVSKILLSATYVGVPTVFNSNYSLCYRLLKRPPEATQRLLTRPSILLPDLPESDDWRCFLEELQKAVPGLFAFSFIDRERELWSFCAGIKRVVAELLVDSYKKARREGRATVDFEMVSSTYLGVQFSASRRDVEALISYAVTGVCAFQNLVCPFQHAGEAAYLAGLKIVRSQRVAEAVTISALSLAETQALVAVEREHSSAGPSDCATKKARKPPRSRPRTAAELLENAKYFLGRK